MHYFQNCRNKCYNLINYHVFFGIIQACHTPSSIRIAICLHNRIKILDLDSGLYADTQVHGMSSPQLLFMIPHTQLMVMLYGHVSKIKIWDLNADACFKTLSEENGFYFTCATCISPANKLVTGSTWSDLHGFIKIWDMRSFVCEKVIKTQAVAHLVAIPYSHAVISSSDYAVKIWDVCTGRCLKTLEENHGNYKLKRGLLLQKFFFKKAGILLFNSIESGESVKVCDLNAGRQGFRLLGDRILIGKSNGLCYKEATNLIISLSRVDEAADWTSSTNNYLFANMERFLHTYAIHL